MDSLDVHQGLFQGGNREWNLEDERVDGAFPVVEPVDRIHSLDELQVQERLGLFFWDVGWENVWDKLG